MWSRKPARSRVCNLERLVSSLHRLVGNGQGNNISYGNSRIECSPWWRGGLRASRCVSITWGSYPFGSWGTHRAGMSPLHLALCYRGSYCRVVTHCDLPVRVFQGYVSRCEGSYCRVSTHSGLPAHVFNGYRDRGLRPLHARCLQVWAAVHPARGDRLLKCSAPEMGWGISTGAFCCSSLMCSDIVTSASSGCWAAACC